MKKLIIINGTMGVGKTTVCQLLLEKLAPGVYLDGDWCWMMNPFVVSEENKAMVERNITALLRSFLENSGYQYIIFCWVLHQEEIFGQILSPLKDMEFELHKITLTASPKVLKERLWADVLYGIRKPDIIERSLQRLPLYDSLDTIKLDVSEISPQQAAELICQMLGA